ncbi:MAG: ACT domain-containing protein, partial [Thermoguttaceae bacterium]
MPRLVTINGCRLESYLDGTLLIFNHKDMPGVIGSVGGVFGKHRVNIAHMSLGRELPKPGGDAIGVLSLDAVPPTDAIKELLSFDGIEKISCVKLPLSDHYPTWMR